MEYLSGVTNEVLDIVSVARIHLGRRAEISEPPVHKYDFAFTWKAIQASNGTSSDDEPAQQMTLPYAQRRRTLRGLIVGQ